MNNLQSLLRINTILCLFICLSTVVPTDLACQELTNIPQSINEYILRNTYSGNEPQFAGLAMTTPTELQQRDTSNSSVKFDSTSSALSKDTSYRYSMTKSSSGAIYRSLVFPGWGQFYNESYIKAGLFATGAVTLISIIVWNHGKFIQASDKYDNLQPTDALYNITYREREFYRDQRDVTGLWFLGVYALAAIDAYVGAHLYDFDVSDKGVAVLPTVQPNGMFALSFQYSF
jgi:hypothetical protein